MGRLERKPGGPDNWIERVGGLPQYIERIAVHLHEERGMTISHAIATAVNTVKRWARKGTVVKYNDPKNNRVTTITAAQAAADVAAWEAKKAMARGMRLSETTGGGSTSHGRLSTMDLAVLAERANAVADPTERALARLKVLDLAMTKDGRKSFKNQGKWKHGFVPVDSSAKNSKAKGSPIARKRMERLYGSASKQTIASAKAEKRTLAQRAQKHGKEAPVKKGIQIRSTTGKKGGGQQERVSSVAATLNADIRDSRHTQRQARLAKLEEVGKGQRSSPRATKPWNDIPDDQKVTRNGKRYVVTYFKGRNLLTEWVGKNPSVEAPAPGTRQFGRIREQDLERMSTGTLRKLLRSGKNSKDVRRVIRRVLKAKQEKNRSRG